MNNVESYTFTQHLHNYSVWTAARAAQRAFTSTKNIKSAIELSSLRAFAESESDITEGDFELFHRKCANEIVESLRPYTGNKSTYGRASKIIAIYLKTSVIIPNKGNCSRSKIIHPPIDGILLKNLSDWLAEPIRKTKPWTLLNEVQYWEMVSNIKSLCKSFDWTLETHWHPELSN